MAHHSTMNQSWPAPCSRPSLAISSKNFKPLQPSLHPLQTTQFIVTAHNNSTTITSPTSTESSPELVSVDQLEKGVRDRISSTYYPIQPPSQPHPAHSAPYAEASPVSPDTAKIAIQASMPPPLTVRHRASYTVTTPAGDTVPPQPLSPIPPTPISKTPTLPPKAFLSCPEILDTPIPVYHEIQEKAESAASHTLLLSSSSSDSMDSALGEKQRESMRSSYEALRHKYRADDLRPLMPLQNPQPVKPFSLLALLCPCVARRLALRQQKARPQTYHPKSNPDNKSTIRHNEKQYISHPKRVPNENYHPKMLRQSNQSSHSPTQQKHHHHHRRTKSSHTTAPAAATTKGAQTHSRPPAKTQGRTRAKPTVHDPHVSELDGCAAPVPGACELDSGVPLSAAVYSPGSKSMDVCSPVSMMAPGCSPVSMNGTVCSPMSPQRGQAAGFGGRKETERVEKWHAHDFGPRRQERRPERKTASAKVVPMTRRV